MDSSGITYAFLIIPSFFALMVVVQGFDKLSKSDSEGYVAIGFGLVFIVIIIAAYFLFIR